MSNQKFIRIIAVGIDDAHNMIQYPYIPPITGKAAERIAEQADFNYNYRQGVDAPSPEERAAIRRQFQQAGLFL